MDQLEQDDLMLGNDNERMVVANLWSYWAHLSIYRFAVPFCRRRTVLDVGTGVTTYLVADLTGRSLLPTDRSTSSSAATSSNTSPTWTFWPRSAPGSSNRTASSS